MWIFFGVFKGISYSLANVNLNHVCDACPRVADFMQIFERPTKLKKKEIKYFLLMLSGTEMPEK